MALTPLTANAVTRDQEMMAAHAQLNTLVTKEVEKTCEAFQTMNTQIQKNLSALAEENAQLKERVTLLESELRKSELLRIEEQKGNLEMIASLKELFELREGNNKVKSPESIQQLSKVGKWPDHTVSGKIDHTYREVQNTRTGTNRELCKLQQHQQKLANALNKQAEEISHLKILLAQTVQGKAEIPQEEN